MDSHTEEILARVDPRTSMGTKIEIAEGPFRLTETNRETSDDEGSLDLGIVARLQDGREVIVGELWAMGVVRGSGGVSIDPCDVARLIGIVPL